MLSIIGMIHLDISSNSGLAAFQSIITQQTHYKCIVIGFPDTIAEIEMSDDEC